MRLKSRYDLSKLYWKLTMAVIEMCSKEVKKLHFLVE